MNIGKIMCSAAVLALTAGLAVSPGAAQATSATPTKFDFNGDGFNDVAVGSPIYPGYVGTHNSGLVAVLYGGANGLNGQQILRPMPGCSFPNPYYFNGCSSFGKSMSGADMDNDGKTDLIVDGTFTTDSYSWTYAGVVKTQRYYTPASSNSVSLVEDKMEVGRFDNLPGTDIVKVPDTGSPNTQYLVGWYNGAIQGTMGTIPQKAPGSGRVNSTAAGDVNGDGKTELAYVKWVWNGSQSVADLNIASPPFASPLQSVEIASSDLCVPPTVLPYGCPQSDSNIQMGDVNADGYDDLVMVTPGFKALQIWYGSSSGLRGQAPNFSIDEVSWLGDSTATNPRFGQGLAVGDVNGDGAAEIVIGGPNTTLSGPDKAGGIAVIPGSTTGPVIRNTQIITQDGLSTVGAPTPTADPISEVSQAGDNFGNTVAVVDVTGDGKGEVIVGTPGKNTGHGMLFVLRGSATGVSATDAQVIHPDTVEVTYRGARFGQYLLH